MRQKSDTWREKTERLIFKAGDYISRQRSDAIQASVSLLEKQNMQLKSEIDLVSQERGFEMREKEKTIKGLDLRIWELETLLAQSENDKELELSRMKSDAVSSVKDYQVKYEELKADHEDLQWECAMKEKHLTELRLEIDKQRALNSQRIELTQTEQSSLKERFETTLTEKKALEMRFTDYRQEKESQIE